MEKSGNDEVERIDKGKEMKATTSEKAGPWIVVPKTKRQRRNKVAMENKGKPTTKGGGGQGSKSDINVQENSKGSRFMPLNEECVMESI